MTRDRSWRAVLGRAAQTRLVASSATKAWAAVALGCLLASWSALAQAPDAPAEGAERPAGPRAPAEPHELTAADVGAFLDGIVPLQLEERDIAGAVVAVVKDGRVLFAKGYGYADVEAKRPVSADATLFRPGSISKLFTWTAVMQLAEQGKVDLDRDVNEYLDYRIPEAFGAPVTLKHLLTHTPGFEEQVKDLFAVGSASPDLGAYLKTHVPRRIYPPGTTPAYSNYGTALAGYVVERVSGRPFDDYVRENIFEPLGMSRSTFAQPLPPDLAPLMSGGYELASDGAKPFEVVNPFPAGSLSSTAEDMARFATAHLQDGGLGGARILRPETARQMHGRLFALDPAANGMAHGFYEESRNGHRIIGHGGDTEYFHSDLHLIKDAGVAFYVSYNSAGSGSGSPRTLLWHAFLDRYFPYEPPPGTPPANPGDAAGAVSGAYALSRRSETTFLKAAYLIGELKVSEAEGGTIEVDQLTGPNGKPIRWREVAPMTFREVGGQESLVFKEGPSGRMEMILPYPFFVGQRVSLWENKSVLVPVLAASLAVMLLTLALWPVAALVRRHYGRKLELTPAEKRLRIGVRLVCALDILFVVGMASIVLYGLENITALNDSLNVWVYLAQAVGVVGAAGTLVVLYDAARAWGKRRRGIWSRLHAALLVLACAGFLWFALAGNLLRFSSDY